MFISFFFQCAIQVYHQVAFTFRLESLPSTADQRKRTGVPSQQIVEGEPFVVEVPSSRQNQVIHNQVYLVFSICQKNIIGFAEQVV